MTELLVPTNATALEATLDVSLGHRVDALATPIAEATRPASAPAAFLPFIAHGRGADLWSPAWPDQRKREVAERAIELGRIKGTLASAREHLALADAELLGAVTPPADFFVGASEAEDAERWEAWLESLPELRIHTARNEVALGYYGWRADDDAPLAPEAYMGAEDGEATCFCAADEVLLDRATLVRDGIESPASIVRRPDPRVGRAGAIYELAWPGPAGAGLFADDAANGADWLDAAPVEPGFARVAITPDAWRLIAPVTRVQEVTPELVPIGGIDIVAVYLDDVVEDRFLDGPEPDYPVYRSLRIMERPADWTAPASFLDEDRFGIPAYTAELLTALPGYATTAEGFVDGAYLDDGFVQPPFDPAALDLACDAVVAAKSLRDTALLDLNIPLRSSLRLARTFSDLQL